MAIQTEFSKREHQVVDLLLQGKSNKQIALALLVAERTVEFHLSHIYAKLGVASRTEAVLKLSENGLRESTGESMLGDMWQSVVEKNDKAADNSKTFFSLRRKPMKTSLYIVGGVILMTALVVVITILAIPPARENSILPTASETLTNPSPTPTLEATATSLQPTSTTGTASASTPVVSLNDVAQFVSETYPDGTKLIAGTAFTKTWTFRNAGTTTWTTDYALRLTNVSGPLGQSMDPPYLVNILRDVQPGETVGISVNLKVPDADGTYSVHWKLQNASGQIVSGAGIDVWATITVGNVMVSQGTISLQLMNVEKTATYTSAKICAQYPDAQDWNPAGVTLIAGITQAPVESYSLDNAKSPSTSASASRCFTLGFASGTDQYGDTSVSISINNFRVGAETNLEANCARAKQQLASQYPGLDFTCGPLGYFYSNLKLPAGMTVSQADKIIMDGLEQVIYGPWSLAE